MPEQENEKPITLSIVRSENNQLTQEQIDCINLLNEIKEKVMNVDEPTSISISMTYKREHGIVGHFWNSWAKRTEPLHAVIGGIEIMKIECLADLKKAREES